MPTHDEVMNKMYSKVSKMLLGIVQGCAQGFWFLKSTVCHLLVLINYKIESITYKPELIE